MIRLSFLGLAFVLGLSSTPSFAALTEYAASTQEKFPQGPRAELTPGSLCQGTRHFRYPERIAYCDRNVDSGLKREVIKEYDEELGYSVRTMPRGDFKIDHYIPLCAGGSNNADNLWPQHESVYKITDPLEPLVCEKMAQGRLLQVDAIALIKEAKNDLSKVSEVLEHLHSL